MSFLLKAAIAIALVVGAASLPANVEAAGGSAAPQKVAALVPVQVETRAAALDQGCFMARKKSAKRKAAAHVRLVKVCE